MACVLTSVDFFKEISFYILLGKDKGTVHSHMLDRHMTYLILLFLQ